ncbi:cyclic nucleotide-binding domain-containing protein [Magnetospira sp. QH-2]|uniref:cyclic nucleotide-binding domain-containing protein n=1 Tax=Magnetospira sp. (strain QH-2) TaxID=1288970 RepID=UPI0003E815B3|nr:cyclic nucleotide-binding domain-containing protein [Magnetospira sp. QH-2]CCQ73753.1 Protein of unknown function. Containing cAMP-binding domain [Magnetospira sp. QH-2]
MDRQTFAPGEVLFKQGDDGEIAYLVEKGAIEISVNEGADKQVLGQIDPGGLFGEMALISSMPRMATATATVEATCVVIPRMVLSVLIGGADPLMSALLLNLIGHIRSLNEKLTPELFEDDEVQFFFQGADGAYRREDRRA